MDTCNKGLRFINPRTKKHEECSCGGIVFKHGPLGDNGELTAECVGCGKQYNIWTPTAKESKHAART